MILKHLIYFDLLVMNIQCNNYPYCIHQLYTYYTATVHIRITMLICRIITVEDHSDLSRMSHVRQLSLYWDKHTYSFQDILATLQRWNRIIHEQIMCTEQIEIHIQIGVAVFVCLLRPGLHPHSYVLVLKSHYKMKTVSVQTSILVPYRK